MTKKNIYNGNENRLRKNYSGFTLAEVLITLGIIGVVAALTLPTLIQNYKKHVVETKLAKFYSTLNNALIASEAKNEDRDYWFKTTNTGTLLDEKGNSMAESWFNEYLSPYLITSEIKTDEFGRLQIFFTDGSALYLQNKNAIRDWFYVTNAQNCDIGNSGNIGICIFPFLYAPTTSKIGSWKYTTKNFEPYTYDWDGTTLSLYNTSNRNGCSQNGYYCTKLIQLNGWKIPKDYPLKF